MLCQTVFPSDVAGQVQRSRAVLLSPFSLPTSHRWPLSHANLPLLFLISATGMEMHKLSPPYLLHPTHCLIYRPASPSMSDIFIFSSVDEILSPSPTPLCSLASFLRILRPPLSHKLLSWVLVQGRTVGQKICQGGWGDNWGEGGGADARMLGVRRPGGQPGFPRPPWQEGVGLN